MKIKVKDEMNTFKIKANHQEIFLLKKAMEKLLNNLKDSHFEVDGYNRYLFDAQEFEDEYQVKSKVNTMVKKFQDVLNEIHPY